MLATHMPNPGKIHFLDPADSVSNGAGNRMGDTGVAIEHNIQIYVISREGLGFYDGKTKGPVIRVRPGIDWLKPCP